MRTNLFVIERYNDSIFIMQYIVCIVIELGHCWSTVLTHYYVVEVCGGTGLASSAPQLCPPRTQLQMTADLPPPPALSRTTVQLDDLYKINS